MKQRNEAVLIKESDGPFTYAYVAVVAVPGLRLPDETETPLQIHSFPNIGAKVYLTPNWDDYCIHMDTSIAISKLMLSGFRGKSRFGKVSIYWSQLIRKIFGSKFLFNKNIQREIENARKQRHRKYKSSGCYLVYEAEGSLKEPLTLRFSQKLGNIGTGFDMINGSNYREIHERALHSAMTSLSLILIDTNGSPEINFLQDMIYLKGSNDFIIYPLMASMGAAALTTSSNLNEDNLTKIHRYIDPMLKNNKIEMATSLFVESQKQDNDNLRSFIAAWSALELLVNHLFKVLESEWNDLLKNSQLPKWDKDLTCKAKDKYRLRDRFYSIACVLNINEVASDTKIFNHINNTRSAFYHRMDVSDKHLPTTEVQSLFRKYMRSSLSSASIQVDGFS